MADSKPEGRSNPRANVFLVAVVCAGAASYPVRVRNLSANGALLEAGSLPGDGEKARLLRGSLCAAGEVAWQRQKHCGIRFDQPIDVEEWVKRAGPRGQQRVDEAVAEFRHDLRPSASLAAVSSESQNETLEDASAKLLQICERISGLPDMSTALAEELLKIETIAQAMKKPRNDPR